MHQPKLFLAAFVGGALAARIQKRRVHSEAASFIGEVPVFNQASASERFNVYFSRKATDAMLSEFCSGKCEFIGHPDAGGVPFVVMKDESVMQATVLNSRFNGIIAAVENDGVFMDDEISESEVTAATWGLERVGAGTGGRTGAGVNIYVLDSGVRVSHQDFGGRAIPTLSAETLPPVECNGDSSCAVDDRGHGSHCAGSAGGTTYGVAPLSTIRAMDRGSSFADAYAAMDWVALNAIRPAVLTMSFGSGGQSQGSEEAVDSVVNQGVTVTVAAGNNNGDACSFTFAYVPSAISVGSSTSTDARSSFSNYGACITIFAPGSSIVSADYRSDTGTSTKSGTSMAAPHVAGGVAVILALEPSLSPAKVKERLLELAEADALTGVNGSPNLLLNVREPYTGPPTPPPPTPAPPPSGTFEVTAGTGCTTTGNCIQSKNHPSNYGNNEGCTISAYDVALTVDAFNTESRYDILNMGGRAYSGTSGPASGTYSGVISWTSDYSVTKSGWKLCKA